MAIAFVTALIAVAGACLQGGLRCGESFCPIDHRCVPVPEGSLCVAPDHLGTCGNGVPEEGEVCEDGNTDDGDGCSADCKSDERCGNGVVDAVRDEVCDDRNQVDGDGCSADCTSDERCGNGVVDAVRGEVCDDRNQVDGDGCSADCTSDERCGNGVVDAVGEETCDCGADGIGATDPACRGDQNSALRGYCRHDCKAHCGDGELAEDEVCDTALSVMTSCFYLRYDFGRPGCVSSCDDLSAAPCGSWNWRRQEPVTSEWLRGVWGSGPQDVFAVGTSGTILHYNG
ncbi:MAG TPA: hypothetical protein VL242_24085, partial [Sorangium sp.]|nr:hypothetical protein [Sorangium sp.]